MAEEGTVVRRRAGVGRSTMPWTTAISWTPSGSTSASRQRPVARSKRCLYSGEATVGGATGVADDAAAEHGCARARVDVVDGVQRAVRQPEHGDLVAVHEGGDAAVGGQPVDRADLDPTVERPGAQGGRERALLDRRSSRHRRDALAADLDPGDRRVGLRAVDERDEARQPGRVVERRRPLALGSCRRGAPCRPPARRRCRARRRARRAARSRCRPAACAATSPCAPSRSAVRTYHIR